MKKCLLLNLGMVEYGKAWQLQKSLFSAKSLNKINDVLILTQHHPTFTIGRRGNVNQLLIPKEELIRRGYSVYKVDRGGAITYHGPGQIVGYPILEMKSYTDDYYVYLRMLEDVMIRTLNEFGIYAGRRTGFTGVWANGEKIGSVGVRIVMGYTMHGFSLNVNNDLSPFSMIIPCNIQDVKMTSVYKILSGSEKQGRQRTLCSLMPPHPNPLPQGERMGEGVSCKRVEVNIVKQFANVFRVKIHELNTCIPLSLPLEGGGKGRDGPKTNGKTTLLD